MCFQVANTADNPVFTVLTALLQTSLCACHAVDEVVGVDFGIPRKQVNLERYAT